jgi:hypothetical protein
MRLSATASEPALTLYRVTRARHTGLFPPPGGRGRFDDPAGEYRVLYAALEREAAFAEALQQFRPDLATRAALAAVRFGAVPRSDVRLQTWAGPRVMLTLRVPKAARLCDLSVSAHIEAAADGIASVADALQIRDFDASHEIGPDRQVSQAVSRWAYQAGYDGLLFPSRLALEWTNCALFNRVRPRVIARDPVRIADPDLQRVAKSFGVRVTG